MEISGGMNREDLNFEAAAELRDKMIELKKSLQELIEKAEE